jgi:hypothetical protein
MSVPAATAAAADTGDLKRKVPPDAAGEEEPSTKKQHTDAPAVLEAEPQGQDDGDEHYVLIVGIKLSPAGTVRDLPKLLRIFPSRAKAETSARRTLLNYLYRLVRPLTFSQLMDKIPHAELRVLWAIPPDGRAWRKRLINADDYRVICEMLWCIASNTWSCEIGPVRTVKTDIAQWRDEQFLVDELDPSDEDEDA